MQMKKIDWHTYVFSSEVDVKGNTEVHWLVCNRDTWRSFYKYYLSLVKKEKNNVLLSMNVLLDTLNNEGESPVLFGARCSNIESVTFFLQNNIGKKQKNNLKENLWFYAIYSNNLELLTILQTFKVSQVRDVYGNTIWHKAARYSNKLILNYLNTNEISEVEIKNKKGVTPLHIAAFYKNDAALDFFENKIFDINDQDIHGNTLLYYLCQSENYHWAKKIIKLGAEINKQNNLGLNCLHWSLYSESTLLYDLLNDYNIRLDLLDKHGKNILIWAIEIQNYTILSQILSSNTFLLEQKTYKEGANPFFWSVAKKDKKAFQILLPYIKNFDELDSEKNTVLFWSIRKKFGDATKILINKGADIHHTNLEGNTVLHEAARIGFTEIIPLLLEMGARRDVYNLEGFTPLDVALKYGQVYLANYLR